MEVTTWNWLGIHDNPVIVFNVAGYYDGSEDGGGMGGVFEKLFGKLWQARSGMDSEIVGGAYGKEAVPFSDHLICRKEMPLCYYEVVRSPSMLY